MGWSQLWINDGIKKTMKWKNTNAKRLPGRFLFSHASLVSVCEQLCLLCSSHCIPAFIWFSLTSNAQKKSVNHIFPHLIVRLNSTLIKMRLLSLKINAALLFIIYFPDCQDGINAIVNMQDYFYWEDIVSILFFNHTDDVKLCRREILHIWCFYGIASKWNSHEIRL